ncbi:MAG: Hsp20/alpha crystallin family protein [Steroidobacteraceae bacterium]|nr:Hsp20/alpha crystallin family protein [Steroidobacteraceae bacterium]MDW8258267.1 Hsp20/alpha crystallin family protein [Gammaproteobacteria bacterium]
MTIADEAVRVALIPRVVTRCETDGYRLRADLPGVLPQDIDVKAEQGVLTVRAARRLWPAAGGDANNGGAPAEFIYRRSFLLPEDADVDAIAARYQHGVLDITVRRRTPARPRRVEIRAA